MTSNWELALSHAKGEYITLIADNDGFINGSLEYLHNMLIKYHSPDIIRWEKNAYYWPDMDVSYIKRLVFKTSTEVEVLNSKRVINDVLDGVENFHLLPMIYNSIISASLLNQLKSKTGKVFKSVNPDIYSGFALAYMAKEYISLGTPITIEGTSSKSNGFNAKQKSSEIIKERRAINEKENIYFNPIVPRVRTIYKSLFEAFLNTQEYLNIQDISLDRKYILETIIKNAILYDERELQEAKEMILNSSKDDKKAYSYAMQNIDELSIQMPQVSTKKLGFYKNVLYLDGEELKINTIYEASKYMSHFYNYAQIF
jgi:hypothetical protein